MEMDRYTREMIASIITIVVIFLAFAIFLAKANTIPTLEEKIKTETRVTVAINCTYEANENCYEVTIRDQNGNDWCYYDTDYVEKGTEINAIFTDGRVVDVEGR